MDNFFALCWDKPPTHPNLTQLIRFADSTDVNVIASGLKQQPFGRKALCDQGWTQWWNAGNDTIPTCNFPGPWLYDSTTSLQSRTEALCKALKDQYINVNYYISDFEVGLSNWFLGQDGINRIVADPRFAPFNSFYNISDYSNVCSDTNKINRWNACSQAYYCRALQTGISEVVQHYFPGCIVNEFGINKITQTEAVPDINGWYSYSIPPYFGNSDNVALYNQINQGLRNAIKADWTNPLNTIIYQVNNLIACKRSGAAKIMPWIAYPNFSNNTALPNPNFPITATQYAVEQFYHFSLCTGITQFLYFNPHPWLNNQDPTFWADDTQDTIVGDTIADLEKVCNNNIPIPLSNMPIKYDQQCLISQAKCGTKTVIRVTFSPKATEANVILPDGSIITIEKPLNSIGVSLIK